MEEQMFENKLPWGENERNNNHTWYVVYLFWSMEE